MCYKKTFTELYMQIIVNVWIILKSWAGLEHSKSNSEEIKWAEVRTRMKRNPFYYVVWKESERHSVDFLLKIIPAKELMLWADGAVSYPAKEWSEIVHAIIFNGLWGDLLNLWEQVSSFVKAGCVLVGVGFQKYHSKLPVASLVLLGAWHSRKWGPKHFVWKIRMGWKTCAVKILDFLEMLYLVRLHSEESHEGHTLTVHVCFLEFVQPMQKLQIGFSALIHTAFKTFFTISLSQRWF